MWNNEDNGSFDDAYDRSNYQHFIRIAPKMPQQPKSVSGMRGHIHHGEYLNSANAFNANYDTTHVGYQASAVRR
jgi:hypothetical protein